MPQSKVQTILNGNPPPRASKKEQIVLKDYQPYFERWTDEEAANTALTLCHMVDKMLMNYQKRREKEFIEGGGIRERMTAARLNRRAIQQQEIEQLRMQLQGLVVENERLRNILAAHHIPH